MTPTGENEKAETFGFQAEVAKLLDIVAHALYSDKQIFLRELISNASDACDRLRYEAITRPELIADDPDFRIEISADPKARTLTITDNGIGMNHEELVEDLGTIARSGTAAFVEAAGAASTSDKGGKTDKGRAGISLIGQFGVGFYASFMVADKVEVLTSKAGEDKAGEGGAWLWTSDGKGEFTIAAAAREARGTTVTLHITKAEKEFLETARIRQIVKTYSDHIAVPIVLKDGADDETLNAASALWTRPKKDITPEQYTEFYRHVGHGFDEPWLTLHWKAEGKIEYTGLLFVPTAKPFDLFDPERRGRTKLYVKRVFITDDCEGLLPRWLRFVQGIVDSEDLPLNISRELLQDNPLLAKIRSGATTRILNELKKKAEKAPEDYAAFWTNFGAVLKEGLYEDTGQRDKLIELARFKSTRGSGDDLVSLADYVGRMKAGQEQIYYLSGADAKTLADSPQLEGFAAKGVEVLLLSDPIDEFWIPAVESYEGKPFKSVTRGGADLSAIEDAPADAPGDANGDASGGGKKKKPGKKPSAKNLDALIALLKLSLADSVADVRASERLTDSPVCLVADEAGLDMNLERMLKQHGRIDSISSRVLEINPGHPLIARLAKLAGADGAAKRLEDAAWLLYDQARILEGETLSDPAAFARRLSGMMQKGLD